MDEVEELHRRARSVEPRVAYDAVVQLGERGAADTATHALLIELVASELAFDDDFSSPWVEVGTYRVSYAAVAAIGKLGDRAIEALIERIVTPQRPEDVVLLERAAILGRPLLELARILITDGDPRRARAAELVVAKFAGELGIEEAVGIYLAVLERERYAPRALPAVLRAIWPALRTEQARRAIAERWVERGLEAWIEGQLDRDPIVACALFALLIAGPAEAERVLKASLRSFTASSRWLAAESLLVIDPVRTGDLLAADPLLWGWATDRCSRPPSDELDLRLVIACGRSPDAMRDFLRSYNFQTETQQIIDVLATLPREAARRWCTQLRDAALPRYQDTRVREAVERVLQAFPL